MAREILEGTVMLVLVFLILSRAGDFFTAMSAIGQTYVGAVRTLQGR